MKINTGQFEPEKGGQVDAELPGQVEAELPGQVKRKGVVNAMRKKVVKSNGFSSTIENGIYTYYVVEGEKLVLKGQLIIQH